MDTEGDDITLERSSPPSASALGPLHSDGHVSQPQQPDTSQQSGQQQDRGAADELDRGEGSEIPSGTGVAASTHPPPSLAGDTTNDESEQHASSNAEQQSHQEDGISPHASRAGQLSRRDSEMHDQPQDDGSNSSHSQAGVSSSRQRKQPIGGRKSGQLNWSTREIECAIDAKLSVWQGFLVAPDGRRDPIRQRSRDLKQLVSQCFGNIVTFKSRFMPELTDRVGKRSMEEVWKVLQQVKVAEAHRRSMDDPRQRPSQFTRAQWASADKFRDKLDQIREIEDARGRAASSFLKGDGRIPTPSALDSGLDHSTGLHVRHSHPAADGSSLDSVSVLMPPGAQGSLPLPQVSVHDGSHVPAPAMHHAAQTADEPSEQPNDMPPTVPTFEAVEHALTADQLSDGPPKKRAKLSATATELNSLNRVASRLTRALQEGEKESDPIHLLSSVIEAYQALTAQLLQQHDRHLREHTAMHHAMLNALLAPSSERQRIYADTYSRLLGHSAEFDGAPPPQMSLNYAFSHQTMDGQHSHDLQHQHQHQQQHMGSGVSEASFHAAFAHPPAPPPPASQHQQPNPHHHHQQHHHHHHHHQHHQGSSLHHQVDASSQLPPDPSANSTSRLPSLRSTGPGEHQHSQTPADMPTAPNTSVQSLPPDPSHVDAHMTLINPNDMPASQPTP